MEREDVRKSLLQQLSYKGADADYYSDVINDYMALWDTKTALQKDIDSRGVVYKDKSSVGIEMYKNNPSVKDLLATNKQMMAILKDLELNTPTEAPATEDDEDDLI